MAKAAPPPEGAEGEAPKKKGKLLIIIIAVVVLLAVAAGGAFFFLKKSPDEAGASAESSSHAKKEKPKKKSEPGKPPTYVNIEPFTVNLAPGDDGDHYLQVVIVLQVEDEHSSETIKGFTPKIRDSILMLLSSKKASDLATANGRADLSDQIKEAVNGAVGTPGGTDRHGKPFPAEGPVEAVLFTSFIIQ